MPDQPTHPPAPGDVPSAGPDAPEPGSDEGATGWRARLAATTAGPRARLRRSWPWLRWPVYGFAAVLVLVVVAGAWLWTTTELPPTPSIAESAVLLDREGNELAVLAQEGVRLEVPLEDVAPVAVDALVAAEDRRFYDHTGIDPIGIGRAMWNNLTEDDLQGGSTITQQLVKNTYLTSDRTLTRKVREAVLAVKLERTEDKDDILERYLNTVYFGRGAYGVEAAARAWFDASAAELDAPQAALLMGMLRAPEALDPTEEPEAAQRRRDAVLETMAAEGFLSAEEAEAAVDTPVAVTPQEPSTTQLRAGVAPHFVEHVRALLVDEFGEQALYDRGLVVRTTLDVADQQAAEAAVGTHLDDPTDPQAALVAVDRSGAVRAWVGGRDFGSLQVDLAAGSGGSGRQPGSTFKPVTLAVNFERGNGAGQRFPAPAEITLDVGDEPWTVSNAGGQDYGTLSLAEATVNSVNTVYAQALLQVGPEAVVDMAHRLGIQRELEAQPSIALGTEEVSPLEMAAVYSTLARSGNRIEPYVMTSVETRDGEVLWELGEPQQEQTVEPRIADTVSAVLEQTPRSGTARRAALDRPMAAKTGTTQDNADAWLAGYTPEYAAVVWVGRAEGNQPMDPVDGQVVQGGTVPAMIWHDFMVQALADVPPTPFPEPDPELLSDTSPPLELTATPRVKPGETVDVTGNGFQLCRNGWWALLEGPVTVFEQPTEPGVPRPPVDRVFVESSPDVGSDDPERRAQLRMPDTAAPGTYQVSARCDAGAGPQPTGPTAMVEVPIDPATTSTTTSSTTTTTTAPDEPPGNGQDDTTTTTTSTTTTSTTTTATEPRGGGNDGG